jgi:hypothetical protein
MQADVQATLPNVHVLVARPVIFNLAEVVRRMITTYGSGVDPAKIAIFIEQNNKNKEVVSSVSEKLAPVLKHFFDTAAKVQLPFSVQVMDIVEQLIINMNWQTEFLKKPSLAGLIETVLSVTSVDSSEPDRRLGVCPVPLYELTEADYDLFVLGGDLEEVRARLKALGIYQYFFPPPDHLLLGLADKRITEDGSLVLAAERAGRGNLDRAISGISA